MGPLLYITFASGMVLNAGSKEGSTLGGDKAGPGTCYVENANIDKNFHYFPKEKEERQIDEQELQDIRDIEETWDKIDATQNETISCIRMAVHGIGTSFGPILKPMTKAFENGVGLSVAPHKKLQSATCADTSCLGLMPMASGKCKQAVNREVTLDKYTTMKFDDDYVRSPQQYSHRSYFWWVARLYKRIFRPGPALEARIKKTMDSLDFEAHRPILAIHMRGTDACADKARHYRKCQDLADFMQHADTMKRLYGFKSILLTTESSVYVEQAKNFPDWKFLINPNINRTSDDTLFEFRNKTTDDMIGDFADYVEDLTLFAQADGMIGKFTSTFERIALPLSYGLKGCAVPYYSLDSSWCTAFGERVGRHLRENTTNEISKRNFSC